MQLHAGRTLACLKRSSLTRCHGVINDKQVKILLDDLEHCGRDGNQQAEGEITEQESGQE